MLESISVIGAAIGGLGLFILAIGMMTDGLKLAAGPSLRKLLSQWSRTPLRGIFAGLLMTGIVQSSSAVTVASIGFVNAGLIRMRQALGIVYGANVGTTMTAWLVALTGFKVNLQALALPLIGIGMLLRIFVQRGRLQPLGMALVGFGLFFIGIDVLKTAFESWVATFDVSQLDASGLGLIGFLLFGIVMTLLTQSSSASIALTITAASTGVIGLSAAAVMVIGANVGTTSTAVLASIGATSSAKRVAAVQVIFNVLTAAVALALLPLLFWVIEELGELLRLEHRPEFTLALFHTIFNVLGVCLIYPINDRLADFIERRFMSWEELQSHPRFLDRNIASTPVLAVNALMLELEAIGGRVSEAYMGVVKNLAPGRQQTEQQLHVVAMLSTQVSKFIVGIEQKSLSEETTKHLATLMRVDQYLLNSAMSVQRIGTLLEQRHPMKEISLELALQHYLEQVLEFVNGERIGEVVEISEVEALFRSLQIKHDDLKTELLMAGTRAIIDVQDMSDAIDVLAEALKVSQQWLKAEQRLNDLQRELKQEQALAVEASDVSNN